MSEASLLEVTIEPAAREEKPALDRLLQLYLHDFSEFATSNAAYGLIGEDGRFPDDTLDRYWQPRRQAWSIRVNGSRAGFALVNDWAPSGRKIDQALAEFFILRKYRRSGVGGRAARMLLRRLPGTWELAVTDYNKPALALWRRTVEGLPDFTVTEFAGDRARWKGPIFRLEPVR